MNSIWNRNQYLKDLRHKPLHNKLKSELSLKSGSVPNKSFPLTNEAHPINVFSEYIGKPPEVDYAVLWSYFKASPELQAILTAVADDIISDGWDLKGTPTNVKRATKFLADNHAKQVFYSVIIDALLTGDGYIWKDKINIKQFNKTLKSIIEQRYIDYETKALENYILKSTEDDIFSTRQIIDVPASTIKIQINEYGDVEKYIQKTVSLPTIVRFDADQIIHFRLMRLNGKTYGYSPSQSLLTIMDVLDDIRDYARFYFRKGGIPNYMFILKDATTTDEDYLNLKTAIDQYTNMTHKYKNLILTGDIDIKELNKMNHDMEFRELARYLTQIMVMVWSIPSTRLSDMLIATGMKGSGTATDGYFRKISHLQDIFEEMINTQLLDDFKVRLEFNRTYLQDELKEAQIAMTFSDTIQKRQALLSQYGKRIRLGVLLSEMRLNEEDIEEHINNALDYPADRQKIMANKVVNVESRDMEIDNANKQEIMLDKKSSPYQEFVQKRYNL